MKSIDISDQVWDKLYQLADERSIDETLRDILSVDIKIDSYPQIKFESDNLKRRLEKELDRKGNPSILFDRDSVPEPLPNDATEVDHLVDDIRHHKPNNSTDYDLIKNRNNLNGVEVELTLETSDGKILVSKLPRFDSLKGQSLDWAIKNITLKRYVERKIINVEFNVINYKGIDLLLEGCKESEYKSLDICKKLGLRHRDFISLKPSVEFRLNNHYGFEYVVTFNSNNYPSYASHDFKSKTTHLMPWYKDNNIYFNQELNIKRLKEFTKLAVLEKALKEDKSVILKKLPSLTVTKRNENQINIVYVPSDPRKMEEHTFNRGENQKLFHLLVEYTLPDEAIKFDC